MSDIKGERGETSFSRHTAGEVALVFFQISLRGNTTYADSGGAKTTVWCWKSENTHLVVNHSDTKLSKTKKKHTVMSCVTTRLV